MGALWSSPCVDGVAGHPLRTSLRSFASPCASRRGRPVHFPHEWENLVLTPFNSPLSNKGEDYAKFTLEQQGGDMGSYS